MDKNPWAPTAAWVHSSARPRTPPKRSWSFPPHASKDACEACTNYGYDYNPKSKLLNLARPSLDVVRFSCHWSSSCAAGTSIWPWLLVLSGTLASGATTGRRAPPLLMLAAPLPLALTTSNLDQLPLMSTRQTARTSAGTVAPSAVYAPAGVPIFLFLSSLTRVL